MLRRLGPAAGLKLGPQVPEAAPSSSPTWPRACTVEAEPARARRVRGWRDEAVERLRGGGQNEIIPARAQPASERHPTQRRPSAITARPQVRRAPTSARAVEVALRGMGDEATVIRLHSLLFE